MDGQCSTNMCELEQSMKWRGTAQLAWEFEALDRPTAVRYLGDVLNGIEAGSEDDYQGHFDFRLSELTDEPPPVPGRPMYVARKSSVLQASDHIAVARSKTMAKRIANALNKHQPTDDGV
jgi:hypothetical protein